MKQLLPLLLIIFLLSNCGQQEKDLNIQGANTMLSQTLNDGTKDTSINRKQMKIFTKDHVMYAAMRFPDSLASYGIGSYEIKDGNVVESFFYTSSNGPQKDTFILKIDKTEKGYKQVIDDLPSEGKKFKLTEEYEKIGKADSTPLDGAWKQVKNYYINKSGDSTSFNEITQFKVYQSGNFIWAASYPDSSRKIRTFFGFGEFAMNGANKSTEVNHLSTYPPIIDSTFNIELEFMGSDSYKQTIVQKDSSKGVEIYERIKK